jgi:hypothetical protein
VLWEEANNVRSNTLPRITKMVPVAGPLVADAIAIVATVEFADTSSPDVAICPMIAAKCATLVIKLITLGVSDQF